MIRALAFCAVIFSVCSATAQSVTPTIIDNASPGEKLGIEVPGPTLASDPEPTIAFAEAPAISACDEQNCPDHKVAAATEKPVDKHTLLRQKLAELNCLQSEIDALRLATGTPEQILVKVQVLEVSRTKLQKMGMDMSALRDKTRPAVAVPYTPTKDRAALGTTAVSDSNTALAFVDQLRQNNVAKALAEPTIVLTCGRPGSFHVGGELPRPAAPGRNVPIDYQKIGTYLDMQAAALGDDRVKLDISANVGEVDYGNNIELNGVQVPAVNTRQYKTGLDLKFGETCVLSGLVQQRFESIKMGREIRETVNEIELIVLVTPETVESAGKDATGEPYHTATSASEERPGERSLRVSKPYTPR